MKVLAAFLGFMFICSTGSAQSNCDLDGGAEFSLVCENTDLGIKIELNGDSGTGLLATRLESPNVRYVPDLEKDLPLVGFERLEEGIFGVRISKWSQDTSIVKPSLDLVAIPASVKLGKLHKLTQPLGALEGSGTFIGRLSGLFNLNAKDPETTRFETKVRCSYNFVRCPR